MTAIQADEGRDNPLYIAMDAGRIDAGTTAASAAVPCEGRREAVILYTIDQPHNRDVQMSDDGATWYVLVGGGLVLASPGATGASANVERALAIPLAGARFVRLTLTNTTGAPATASVKVMLR